MSTYSIAPYTALGGTVGNQQLVDVYNTVRSPHTAWVERLRLATDFISADNSLICVADNPFHEYTTNVAPLGLCQSFNASESLPSAFAPEIGSRRKRAIIGSSQGGGIQISKVTVIGASPLKSLTQYNSALGLDPTGKFWSEDAILGLCGLNHDLFRTPIGLIVVDTAPDGRNYRCRMYEQCVIQGQADGYQAGQAVMIDNINLQYEQVVPVWSIATDPISTITSGGTV